MRATPHAAAGAGKLAGLELLRCVAAFAVLVWHYQHFAFNGNAIDIVRNAQPFYVLLRPFYEYGWYGVQVFWSISGFIFFWRYRAAVAGGQVSARTFFLLRFSRLYPLHAFTLVLVALLQLVHVARAGHYFVYPHNDAWHFLLQLFLASHWGLQEGYSFNGPIWSISVEALVYGVFFAGLRLAGTSLLPHVAAIALAAGLKLAGLGNSVTDCIGYFYAGGLAALLTQQGRIPVLFSLALVVTLAAPVAAYFLLPASAVELAIMAYAPWVLYLLAQPLALPAWLVRLSDTAGSLTYASYLLHFPIQLVFALALAERGIPVYSPMLFLAFIGATGLASWLSFRYLEWPAQQALRRRFGAVPLALAHRG